MTHGHHLKPGRRGPGLALGTSLVLVPGALAPIAIRRGKAPGRRDRCLMPGARKPAACPAV